jgi:hypothetical protein
VLLLGSRGTVPPKDRLGRHGASAGAPPGDWAWAWAWAGLGAMGSTKGLESHLGSLGASCRERRGGILSRAREIKGR